MSVPAAYLAVVLIWSTTPLGIVWSTESITPTFAVFARMLIAVAVGVLFLKLFRIPLPWHKQAVRLYAYASIGIAGGMILGYNASVYITSGVMSLIFGLSPIISGVLAKCVDPKQKTTSYQYIALLICVTGLSLVCSENLQLNPDSWKGIVLITGSVTCFSLSGVLVKTVKLEINPFASTMGSLILSTPIFGLAWLMLTNGEINLEQWQLHSVWAVIYLGIFGSLIGFIAYYYILQKLTATTVALVTLITPPIALILGAWLNQEVISQSILLGASLILLGLGLYQFGGKLLFFKAIDNKQLE
ncbi:EamA family transporter [Saccharobesus litoralis]|uniref:EamA family transporter n=1 Tax=Saccharobesus litoralis TaxID=2172099 RepID=A0A2S0VV83_9ALTE|nr:DMT family transporter [Saccharobesus litoralis]AWB68010.1 EamA family transporter [Saccharobesus litoralis]